MSFFELFMESLPMLAQGMKMTLQMTVVSLIFAIILGMISCFFKISRFKILNWISNIYLNLIRGTPLLVQASFLYFGVPSALNNMFPQMNFVLTSFAASVIILSLNAGAYLSEIFRSGINAVNKGQMEAARSLGLPYGVAMRKVVLPQAIRIVTPSVVNQFIITLKDTSILSAIGMPELMRSGTLIVARTFRGFEVYGIVAIMYFIMIMILTKISSIVERKMSSDKGSRR